MGQFVDSDVIESGKVFSLRLGVVSGAKGRPEERVNLIQPIRPLRLVLPNDSCVLHFVVCAQHRRDDVLVACDETSQDVCIFKVARRTCEQDTVTSATNTLLLFLT